MFKIRIAGLAFALSTTAALAEPLSGTEMVGLLGAGDLVFVAGSVASFEPDSTYTFRHANGTQAGTYKVFSNGAVTFVDGNTEHTFIIDRDNSGTLEVQYTGGPQRGDKYRLR